MIKANELRIGNWVLEAGEPSIVYHIERGGTSMYRINDIPYNRQTGCTINGGEDRISPIPLTPEILENCGLERKDTFGSVSYFKNGGTFYFSILYDDTGNCFLFDSPHYGNLYKCLHQLQNLYFALTGEELPVNFKELTYQ